MFDYTAYQSKNNHTWLKIALLSIVLVLFIAGGLILYLSSKFNTPLTYYSRPVTFEVKPGESAREVGSRLEEENIISSALAFRAFLILHGRPTIQAGRFALDSALPLSEIVEHLSLGKGSADEVQLTFVEGDTAEEYRQQLAASGIEGAAGFLDLARDFKRSQDYGFLADSSASASLEGYLFPDTYRFSKSASADAIIDKFLSNFERKLNSELQAEISRTGRGIFEVVIMASLVEGEVGRNFGEGAKLKAEEVEKIETERKLVASVFYNRLDLGMALQSDATITYITGVKKARATAADLEIDSPYNTYKYRGLPPGPIGNPSLEAIRAAVYPAESDYLYFLSKADGEAVFAKTLDEHNANKARYLK